jgi:hypothetical protein
LNQINNQDDDRNYEQEMDQTAANVAKKAKKPEHDQDNNYRPEQVFLSVELNFRGPFIQKFVSSPSSFRTRPDPLRLFKSYVQPRSTKPA